MMELFYAPGACSMAPHIALIELGIDYKLHKLDLKNGEQKSPEYLKVNPKGYVPAVKLASGEILTEAAVILQYLADKKPEKNLFPQFGGDERYKAMQWLNFVSTEFHKGFGFYFGYARLKNQENASELKAMNDARMTERMNLLSAHLEKNKYMLGSEFSIVDAYLGTVLNWSGNIKFDITPWPKVMGYLEQFRARSSVQQAMKEEGLISEKKA